MRIAVALWLATILGSQTAQAGLDSVEPDAPGFAPPAAVVSGDGDITVRVDYTDVVYSFGGSGGPVCTWTHLTTGDYETFFDLVDTDPPDLPPIPELPTDREPTPEEIAERDRIIALHDAERVRLEQEAIRLAQPAVVPLTQLGTVVDHRVFSAVCPGRGFNIRFIAVTTDEPALLANVEDIAHGRIPDATPDISPSADAGGIVGLGMWLAVSPPPDIGNITAEAGPVWVTVSPRHRDTTFDFGNGDTITCDGIGDPIDATHADHDTVEQSPICGYTYERSSPDADPYSLTIAMTWTLTYTSSTGTGTLSPTPAPRHSTTTSTRSRPSAPADPTRLRSAPFSVRWRSLTDQGRTENRRNGTRRRWR